MITYYYLHGKCFDGDMFEGSGTNDRKEIFTTFKEKVIEKVDISPELERIAKSGLPSPKYRASVYKYLDKFFNSGKFPRAEIIDYSDFEGKKRPFPPRDPEEETYTEYENLLGFHETYRNDFRNITEYDWNLGFVFAVNDRGFHLEMLGEYMDTVAFYFRGKESFRAFAFNPFFSEDDDNSRGSWHMRIQTSQDRQLSMLSGSYPVVMLLNLLLKETKKKPIYFSGRDRRRLEADETDMCFSWIMNNELHEKINNEKFVLPKKTNFDDSTMNGYIERLIHFGYDVKMVKTDIKYFDDNGEEQTIHRKEYYIPPFLCKQDSNLIIQCISDSELSEEQKQYLLQKFISESGCNRYSKDDLEESEIPTPSAKDWKDNDYALIIYTVMRLAARPLPITSTTKDVAKRKDNLMSLIATHYGSPKNRNAITDNINSMVAVGLPIIKEGKKFVFDMRAMLSARDLELLQDCIAKSSALDEISKARLIDKVKIKFKNTLI